MEYGKMVKGVLSYDDNSKNTKVPDEKEKVDRVKVESYLLAHKKYFPPEKLIYMKNKMLDLDPKSFDFVSTTKLKSPNTVWLFSIFLGIFGVDRFMIGDIGKGILKLLTFGGCTLFFFYDIFAISNRVKKLNFENIIILM